MKLPERTFTFAPAVRSAVPCWICLFGPSGCGKTYTSLELATGAQAVVGGRIKMIDTEGGRGKAYAEFFDYDYAEFVAPFGSLDYEKAIRDAYAAGGRVIIVDSMSHEHEGVGGLLDFQEAEVERMAGSDMAKRERVKMLAWNKPKRARRQLLNAMVSMKDVTFILDFRASDQSKPNVRKEGGQQKSEVIHLGFVPIGARDFVYEATLSLFLPPASKGVPDLTSDNVGERMMRKIPRQFESLIAQNEQLSRKHGKIVAEWARGGAARSNGNGEAKSLESRVSAACESFKKKTSRAGLNQAKEASAGLRAELESAGRGLLLDQLDSAFDDRMRELPEAAAS